MKKIILITDSLQDSRILKRILLLESNGYSTKLFGFTRGEHKFNSNNLPHEVIGDIGELSYFKRIFILFNGIRCVIKKFQGDENVIFYLFGIQVAIIFKLLSKQPYIYEEADLVHTYLKVSILKRWFEKKDKQIILDSKLSIFTSEGFIQYHFLKQNVSNSIVIPNKLTPTIQSLKSTDKSHTYNPDNIQFGFVGGVRFESTIHFIEHVVKTYPQHVFHLFGIVDSKYTDRVNALSTHENFIHHGVFKNPDNLPQIYATIDFVLSTYDTKYENVRYAEPNKLYESIYFRVPIIVSDNTFLANKVEKYGFGVSVNALDTLEIDKLIKSLTVKKYDNLIASLNSIDKSIAVDSGKDLVKILKRITSDI